MRAVGNVHAPAEAWREYGFALERNGQPADALRNLRIYLTKKPDADDRLFIEQDIARLETRL